MTKERRSMRSIGWRKNWLTKQILMGCLSAYHKTQTNWISYCSTRNRQSLQSSSPLTKTKKTILHTKTLRRCAKPFSKPHSISTNLHTFSCSLLSRFYMFSYGVNAIHWPTETRYGPKKQDVWMIRFPRSIDGVALLTSKPSTVKRCKTETRQSIDTWIIFEDAFFWSSLPIMYFIRRRVEGFYCQLIGVTYVWFGICTLLYGTKGYHVGGMTPISNVV